MRWIYVVLTSVLMLAFGALFATAIYVVNSPGAGIVAGLFVLGGIACFVLRDGFGFALIPGGSAKPVPERELPWRYASLVMGYAFAAWCIYIGVHALREREAQANAMERLARAAAEHSVGRYDD